MSSCIAFGPVSSVFRSSIFFAYSNNKEASFPALKDFNCIDNKVHRRFYVYAKLFSVENVASAVIIP